MIGFIVCNEATYPAMRKMTLDIGDKAGGQDIFLALRGLRTLEMRMRHTRDAGIAVARWLAEQPQTLNVLHPAFPDCPGHAFWQRDFSGAAGLFSLLFKPCSDAQLHAFVDALSLFSVGVSWGGFESLVLPVKPHRTAAPWTAEGRVVRFSIGNEDINSLIDCLSGALKHLD